MGYSGASCFHTLKTDSRDIDKYAWDKERFGMLCTKVSNFSDWKTVIEELCHETKECTFELIRDRIQSLVTKTKTP